MQNTSLSPSPSPSPNANASDKINESAEPSAFFCGNVYIGRMREYHMHARVRKYI